jgi:nicotinamide mononucleotide transporter PnuC
MIMVLKRFAGYFSLTEKVLWTASVLLTVGSFLLLQRTDYIALAASLVGVTSLILCAKGNPIGQILMVAFSILYAVISYGFAYYGEMLTYLGMTAPMAVVALVEWLRHPYRGNRSEVAVRGLCAAEIPLMLMLAAAVTAAFYFLLLRLGTANMFFSTLSVTTSFVAAYLTFKRSPYFALA